MAFKEKEEQEYEQGHRINRTGIPDDLLQRAEEKAGMSFEDVRVHYNSAKPMEVGARAFTQGNHIYIGAGNEDCLKHELGHIPQQEMGRVPVTTTIGGYAVNDDPVLEREADRFL
ncbi:MAG: DUF4157 domain-containing protein [Lachnospiraceae bacterium]|nr:DUF4157 domain-containing protein [Lachnospiraceae bacterium]